MSQTSIAFMRARDLSQPNTDRSTRAQESPRTSLEPRPRDRASYQTAPIGRNSSTPTIKLIGKSEPILESRTSTPKLKSNSPSLILTSSLLQNAKITTVRGDFKTYIDQGYRKRKPKTEIPAFTINNPKLFRDSMTPVPKSRGYLSETNRLSHDSGTFRHDPQGMTTTAESKLKSFQNRLKPLIQNREEIRNGKLINNSPHKHQIMKLVTQFEDILNFYVDNFLVLSEKDVRVAETALEVELTAYSIIKQLFQDLHAQHTENIKLTTEVSKTEAELKALRKQWLDKKQHDVEVENILKRVNEIMKRGENQENAINVERNRMEMEKQMISDEITNFKKTIAAQAHQIQLLTEERQQLQSKVKVLEKDREELKVKIAKFEVVATNNMNKMAALIKEYDLQREKLDNFNSIVSSIEYDRDKALEMARMYRERGLMQLEECGGIIGAFARYREGVVKMREKMLAQEVKMTQQLEKRKDEREEMRKDQELILSLKESFLKDHTALYAEQPLYDSTKEQAMVSEIDIKVFQIKKAPFGSLFDDLEENKKMENKKFGPDIIVTIRAIFDSKYNEFLLYGDDFHKITRFPDFVFGWLGKFCVDTSTRKIRQLTFTDSDPDAIRRTFYLMLEDSKCMKIWDAITFKEFLSESMAADELLFYLHTRMLLFDGPQLKRLPAQFNYKDLVTYERVEALADHVLAEYVTKQELEFLKTSLKTKIVPKNDKKLMDGSLVLRVILEAYRKVKELRFHMLWKYITGQSNIGGNTKNFSISYRGLANVIHSIYPNYSETELAEIYRKTWALGKGKVNQSSVLATLNETGYLIRLMKLKPWTQLPTLLPNSQFNPQCESSQLCQYLNQKFKEMYGTIESFHNFLKELGMETLSMQVSEYEKVFESKFQVELGSLNGQNLASFTLRYLSMILRVGHAEISARSARDHGRTDVQLLSHQVEAMMSAFKDYNSFKKEDARASLKESNWVRKFQRFAKGKVMTWNNLLGYVLKENFKKKEQEEMLRREGKLAEIEEVHLLERDAV